MIDLNVYQPLFIRLALSPRELSIDEAATSHA
jgi:hypothetical protein